MSDDFKLSDLGGAYIDYTECVAYKDIEGKEEARVGDLVALIIGGVPRMKIKFTDAASRPALADDRSLIFDDHIKYIEPIFER